MAIRRRSRHQRPPAAAPASSKVGQALSPANLHKKTEARRQESESPRAPRILTSLASDSFRYCLDAATIGPGSARPSGSYSGWAGFESGPSSATEMARTRILSLVGKVIVLALAGKSIP